LVSHQIRHGSTVCASVRHDAAMHRHDEVHDALRRREPIFHRVESGTSREAFEAMTTDDYWEVGASGAVYDLALVLDILAQRYADPAYDPLTGLEVTDFAVREAGDGVWLATYQLRQGERITRRVTVWRDTPSGWQVAYHPGTVIAGGR
jgi:hypothetical protein